MSTDTKRLRFFEQERVQVLFWSSLGVVHDSDIGRFQGDRISPPPPFPPSGSDRPARTKCQLADHQWLAGGVPLVGLNVPLALRGSLPRTRFLDFNRRPMKGSKWSTIYLHFVLQLNRRL